MPVKQVASGAVGSPKEMSFPTSLREQVKARRRRDRRHGKVRALQRQHNLSSREATQRARIVDAQAKVVAGIAVLFLRAVREPLARSGVETCEADERQGLLRWKGCMLPPSKPDEPRRDDRPFFERKVLEFSNPRCVSRLVEPVLVVPNCMRKGTASCKADSPCGEETKKVDGGDTPDEAPAAELVQEEQTHIDEGTEQEEPVGMDDKGGDEGKGLLGASEGQDEDGSSAASEGEGIVCTAGTVGEVEIAEGSRRKYLQARLFARLTARLRKVGVLLQEKFVEDATRKRQGVEEGLSLQPSCIMVTEAAAKQQWEQWNGDGTIVGRRAARRRRERKAREAEEGWEGDPGCAQHISRLLPRRPRSKNPPGEKMPQPPPTRDTAQRVEVLVGESRYGDAAKEAAEAVAKGEKEGLLFIAAAKAHLLQYHTRRAREMLTAARYARLDPRSLIVLQSLSNAVAAVEACRHSLAASQHHTALQHADAAAAAYPRPLPLPLFLLQAEALVHCSPADALHRIRGWGKTVRDCAQLHFLHAKALYFTSHDRIPADAIAQLLHKALSCDPDHSPSRSLLDRVHMLAELRDQATALSQQGEWSRAREVLARALELDLSGNKALILGMWLQRAQAALSAGDTTGAFDDLAKAMQVNDRSPALYMLRAKVLHRTRNYPAAIRDLTMAARYGGSRLEYLEALQAMRRVQHQHQLHTRRPPPAKQSCPGCHVYNILEVPRDVTDSKVIIKAYHRKALVCHPDRCKDPDAEQRFKELGNAKLVLTTPSLRARNDKTHTCL